MREEIAAAVFFLTRLARKGERLDERRVARLTAKLTVGLLDRYKNHWYPEQPSRGQAYRCLRMNGIAAVDPVLATACEASGVAYVELCLPRELTVWVDPGEVSCRYGEKSHAFTVTSLAWGSEPASLSISAAVERATGDSTTGSSPPSSPAFSTVALTASSSSSISSSVASLHSDDAAGNFQAAQPIETVCNPNSVYQVQQQQARAFSASVPSSLSSSSLSSSASSSAAPEWGCSRTDASLLLFPSSTAACFTALTLPPHLPPPPHHPPTLAARPPRGFPGKAAPRLCLPLRRRAERPRPYDGCRGGRRVRAGRGADRFHWVNPATLAKAAATGWRPLAVDAYNPVYFC
ncbi:uncharacterized protein LOC116956909 [Petromyzon marinus]|uniref:uncharacterized protein LOC116956909 n=1 Tax=Petromyzon marinus TaxID=7757 RepID=UPI003F703F57